MGKIYKWDTNPFQDYLFRIILYGADISDKKYEAEIYTSFIAVIDYLTGDRNNSQHLDFEIRKKGVYFKVVAKNAITAFWLSGIFPRDPAIVLETNEYVIDNIKYKYNRKTKKLTQKLMEK